MKIQKACRCGKIYFAREADLKRGWGKSCSKKCAAIKRAVEENKGTHKLAPASKKYRERFDNDFSIGSKNWNDASAESEMGWDAHKGYF